MKVPILVLLIGIAMLYIVALRQENAALRAMLHEPGLRYVASNDSTLTIGLETARALGGGTIYMSEGEYTELGQIPSGTKVIGSGKARTVVNETRRPAVRTPAIIIDPATVRNVKIENVTIQTTEHGHQEIVNAIEDLKYLRPDALSEASRSIAAESRAALALAALQRHGVVAMKSDDRVPRFFQETQAGVDAAVTYCTPGGNVMLGPAVKSLSPSVPVPSSVTLHRVTP